MQEYEVCTIFRKAVKIERDALRDLEVELDRKITLPNGPGMMRKVRQTGIEARRSSLWLQNRESSR